LIAAGGRDEKTGLPVFRLDGRSPAKELLAGIDTLVLDVQDAGVRWHPDVAAAAGALQEAAKRRIRLVVLDRPDLLGGAELEGPVSNDKLAIPARYAMTMGELLSLLNAERKIRADLSVVKMVGWRRADYFDATALEWIEPSPDIRNLTEALLYPGVGLLEDANVSVGRGTAAPFELVGAPGLDGAKLSERLDRAGVSGARFVPVHFTPRASPFVGEVCAGVGILVTDRAALRPVALGIEIARQLRELSGQDWGADGFGRRLADPAALAALKAGAETGDIVLSWQPGLADFARVRRQYLLY
jgi:uncharacterized protein YbbC (DUF1343 family)